MMNARTLVLALLALGATSNALAQQPVQLKFSRVVDLTILIESNMPGIPGIKTYADNPSKVDVVTAITEAQKGQLQTEGMTLNSNLAVNGRAMISVCPSWYTMARISMPLATCWRRVLQSTRCRWGSS
jgi:hypothetical protein